MPSTWFKDGLSCFLPSMMCREILVEKDGFYHSTKRRSSYLRELKCSVIRSKGCNRTSCQRRFRTNFKNIYSILSFNVSAGNCLCYLDETLG